MDSNRSTRRNRGIQGPHSALTDFLAANNISAADIRDSYLRRRQTQDNQNGNNTPAGQHTQAATVATAAAGPATATPADAPVADGDADEKMELHDSDDSEVLAAVERSRASRKRKSTTAAAEKAKAAKKKKKRASKSIKGEDADDDDDDYFSGGDDPLSYASRKAKKPPLSTPGQLANCEDCDKRFTVTPYSKTGPDGGLLCGPCGKKLAAETKKDKPKAKKPARKGRRQVYSNLLDGVVSRGALSLLDMCIKRVADNIHDVEEFGDLPGELLRRLSQILSKRRALTQRTLELFLRQDMNSIEIFDCAKLEEDDFRKIFAFMPSVEKVDFRFAGQMKDSVLEYITARPCHIKYLCLDACNLISDERWFKFFEKWGSQLEVLKLSNMDCSMGDEAVAHMVEHCPNLRSLKMKELWKMGDESLKSIAKLEKLEHLSLCLVQQVEEETLVDLIQRVGPNLRTLSLERGFKSASDKVLETIHDKCSKLSKLRFCDNIVCTDKGFTNLFTEWRNPGLTFIDVSGTRDMDNANPDGPEDPIGLASEGFKALMAHSGHTIQHLNISSCRHVSFDAFSEVFKPDKLKYPRLKELDISFHTRVDDFLVGAIFKCCPAMTKLIAFACFGVRDAQAPPGVALIGGLNAHKSIGQDEGV